MSASASIHARKLPRESRTPPATDQARFVVLAWSVAIPVAMLLAILTVTHRSQLAGEIWRLSLWAGVVFLVDLLPIQFTRSYQITMSFPVLLAAGMIMGPIEAGILGFFASSDPRELRGEISLARALFNRSQIAFSCMAAVAVFHMFDVTIVDWPLVMLATLAAVIVDVLINQTLVGAAIALGDETPVAEVAARVLRSGALELVFSYLSLGFLGLLVASAFERVGEWTLLASLVPVVMARQFFAYVNRSEAAAQQVAEKVQTISELSKQIADERRDERGRVAACLHDDVLPALYKVHLMGEVLRNDLSTGRLLELEEDLPPLLQATETASDSIRSLIRDLRSSSIGAGGLTPTLQLFLEEATSEGSIHVEAYLEDVRGTPFVQLLVYQVAREAIRNTLKHANASKLNVKLFREGDAIRLLVEDDGCGFTLAEVDRQGHFGLQMMKERVELAGGVIHIETLPGAGTRVMARFAGKDPKTF